MNFPHFEKLKSVPGGPHPSEFYPFEIGTICLFIGGSQLHGAKLEGMDDTDWYGVYIEPPEYILGMKPYEHWVCSTGDPTKTNTAQDVDVTMWSLRKAVKLIASGNPTALHFLFASPQMFKAEWKVLQQRKHLFVSKYHAAKFLGYAVQQRRSLLGERTRDCSRKEIIAEHGFDTKYAMHYIRILQEGIEYLRDGNITFPRPEVELLKSIRRGKHDKWTLGAVIALGDGLVEQLKKAEEESPLPDCVDMHELSMLTADLYRSSWNRRRLTYEDFPYWKRYGDEDKGTLCNT